MEEKAEIEELRKGYEKLKEKYDLPEFEKLAEDFDIEKIEHESSFVLRDVRLKITEKVAAYLHFFEVLINPASPPIFIFSILKNLDEDDKKKIKEIYKKVAKLQLEGMKLDTIYSEENEAKFISETSEKWKEIKEQVKDILEKLEKDFDAENNSGKKGYVS